MSGKSDTGGPRLSLCVGVTGHRDIEPESRARVAELVGEAFDRLKSEFGGLDIVLFSSLAEGGDQLVADVLLRREPGARLVVPLPAPVEEYEKDFEGDARREFHRLLALADNHFVVAREAVPERPGEDGTDPRIAGYRRAGLFVARSCHVLIALWDGKRHGSPAGTWEIVLAKEAGESPIGRADPARATVREPRGVVVHVRTPRSSDTVRMKPRLEPIDRKTRAWKSLATACGLTSRFNEDARRHIRDIEAEIARSNSAGRMRGRPPEAPPGVDRLIELYAAADGLAIKNQQRVRFSWLGLYGTAVAAVFAYGIYAHNKEHDPLILGGYLAALFVSFALFKFVYWRGWHGRFLDYRGLAEGLRVAFFWRVAGLEGDPVDRYPANLAGEVEWVRLVLRGETARWEPREPASARVPATIAYTVENWVADQARYFHGARRRHATSAWRAQHLTHFAVGLGVTLAAILLGFQLLHPHPAGTDHPWWFYAWLVAIAAFPAIGAAIAGYADRRGYEAQERQYERMEDLFDHAAIVLASLTDDREKRMVLRALAGEALAEHAQWIVLHRERPFEFVAGA